MGEQVRAAISFRSLEAVKNLNVFWRKQLGGLAGITKGCKRMHKVGGIGTNSPVQFRYLYDTHALQDLMYIVLLIRNEERRVLISSRRFRESNNATSQSPKTD